MRRIIGAMRFLKIFPPVLLIAATLACGAPAGVQQAPGAGAPARVESLDKRASLAGPWKVRIGDDARYADAAYDDAAWDTVSLPGSLMPYVLGKTGRDRGVLWIRKSVDVDRGAARDGLGLILGRIGNADETFFNGVMIGGMGEFPPEDFSMWNHPRYYPVQKEFIRYGATNTIAVRISYNIFGEVLGELAVTGMKDWKKSAVISRFLLIDLSYYLIAMGFTLLLIHGLFFIIRPGSQEYLYYCLQLMCGLLIVLEVCTYWNIYGSMVNRFKILGFGWVAINVAHPIFLHRIYDLKRKKIEITLWAYLAIFIIVALFFTYPDTLRLQGIALILVTLVIGPYNISCHISALIKKRPYAKTFGFFGIIVVIGAIHDGIIYLLKLTGSDLNLFGPLFQYMIFQYAAAALYVGTSLTLVFRFARIMDEVEDLNTSLENFVIENALLNERLTGAGQQKKKDAGPVLTGEAEVKIQQVVNYINSNYTFDISREGLAATVDVHPDNLGKLFKRYTAKKLGDYINELRVRDAARMLAETDESIIQIAFSVGFDSLRTFNRAFPKFMNMTPEKYRKTHRG